MAKRKSMAANVAAIYEPPPPALKKQSAYGCAPWQPGEVPRGMIFTTRPGGKEVAPWCRPDDGVQPPTNAGKRGPIKL